jgi:hypothetical protein
MQPIFNPFKIPIWDMDNGKFTDQSVKTQMNSVVQNMTRQHPKI